MGLGGWGRFLVWGVAVVLLGLSRFPAQDLVLGLLVGVGVLGLVGLAGLSFWERAPRRTRGLLFLLGLGVFLVPVSSGAVLAGVSDWLVALVFVLALHLFFQDPGTKAPVVGGSVGGRVVVMRGVLRFLPGVLLVLGLVVLPLLFVFLLPLRVFSVFELNSAFEPLFVLLWLGVLVGAVGVLWVWVQGFVVGRGRAAGGGPEGSEGSESARGSGEEFGEVGSV